MRFSVSIHRSIVLSFFVALLGLGQTKPAAKPVPAVKKGATAASHPQKTDVQTDAQIEKAIRQRFAASKISADKFEVHVQGGRATITGATEVLQHKGTATRLARAAGAEDVVNKIEPSEAAKNKANTNLAKGRRRAQIKRSDTVARSEQR
jgi:osmotically-inducible protein OsmY